MLLVNCCPSCNSWKWEWICQKKEKKSTTTYCLSINWDTWVQNSNSKSSLSRFSHCPTSDLWGVHLPTLNWTTERRLCLISASERVSMKGTFVLLLKFNLNWCIYLLPAAGHRQTFRLHPIVLEVIVIFVFWGRHLFLIISSHFFQFTSSHTPMVQCLWNGGGVVSVRWRLRYFCSGAGTNSTKAKMTKYRSSIKQIHRTSRVKTCSISCWRRE